LKIVCTVGVKVSASLTNVGSLAVGAFDLVNCSLSVVGFVPVFDVDQQVLQMQWRFKLMSVVYKLCSTKVNSNKTSQIYR